MAVEKEWAALESWVFNPKLARSLTDWTSLVMEANYTGDCSFWKVRSKFIKFEVLHSKYAGKI